MWMEIIIDKIGKRGWRGNLKLLFFHKVNSRNNLLSFLVHNIYFFINIFWILFIYFYFLLFWVFVAARGLSQVIASRGYSLAAVHGLIVVASLIAEHRLINELRPSRATFHRTQTSSCAPCGPCQKLKYIWIPRVWRYLGFLFKNKRKRIK